MSWLTVQPTTRLKIYANHNHLMRGLPTWQWQKVRQAWTVAGASWKVTKKIEVRPPHPHLNCLSVFTNFGTATAYENLSSKQEFRENRCSNGSNTAVRHSIPPRDAMQQLRASYQSVRWKAKCDSEVLPFRSSCRQVRYGAWNHCSVGAETLRSDSTRPSPPPARSQGPPLPPYTS